MSTALSSRAAVFALACTLASACGGGTGNADGAAPDASAKPSEPSQAADAGQYASTPENPCEWIPAADVEHIVGPLAGTPTRVRSAESPTSDARGSGCLYRLVQPSRLGEATVTVQVVLNQGVVEEHAIGKMRDVFARELSDGAVTKAEPSTASAGPWDYAGRLPNLFIGRQGTIGVHVGTQALDIRSEKLGALAAAVLDRLPDRPITLPPDPDLAALTAMNPDTRKLAPTSPDPCTLLTRAEAEAILGPLSVAPYRSAKDSALATPQGESCSYYTARHRALVITPEWSGGKMLFGMVRGVSGVTGSVRGGSTAAPAVTGPWEKITVDTSDGLVFLKGDRMLTMHYRTSTADKDAALRLATQAVTRL